MSIEKILCYKRRRFFSARLGRKMYTGAKKICKKVFDIMVAASMVIPQSYTELSEISINVAEGSWMATD